MVWYKYVANYSMLPMIQFSLKIPHLGIKIEPEIIETTPKQKERERDRVLITE